MKKTKNSFMPIIIIVVLVSAIVLAGCLTLQALNSEAQKLTERLGVLEKEITDENWDEALKKLEEFHNIWDRTSSPWSMLIDHYEIDSIELALSELISYVKTKDESEALSRLSSLKALIIHIPNKESFNLKNIL